MLLWSIRYGMKFAKALEEERCELDNGMSANRIEGEFRQPYSLTASPGCNAHVFGVMIGGLSFASRKEDAVICSKSANYEGRSQLRDKSIV